MSDELDKTNEGDSAQASTVEASQEAAQPDPTTEAETPEVVDSTDDLDGPADEPEEDTRTDAELGKVKEASLAGLVNDGTGDEEDDASEAPDPSKRDWYILKVQSNRENSISAALLRRVKIEGVEDYFGDIIVPTEKVSEFKGGKKRVVKRKLYPGYIVVHMQITDASWFLVRETPGIGDFTGAAGKPTPMLQHEIAKILELDKPEEEQPEKLNIRFKVGDRVKINDGTFESFEGDVDTIDETSGRVTIMINIFGRSTPVELEHWQIESI